MKQSITTLLSVLVILFGVTSVVHADTAEEIKVRMAKRLAQIVALKQNESLGENNQGYLSVRKNLSEKDTTLVKAENADRQSIYQIIADKTESSAAIVGRTRAASIRKTALKGTWVQLPNGSWTQV